MTPLMVTQGACLKMLCRTRLARWPGITKVISLLVFQGMSWDTLLVIEESQMMLSGGLLLKYSGRIGEVSLQVI
jgi:hypothetical protein